MRTTLKLVLSENSFLFVLALSRQQLLRIENHKTYSCKFEYNIFKA